MKKLIVFTAFFLFYSGLFSQALHDITSPSPANVFAVGTNGLILKSKNGGSSYSSILSGTSNLNSVYAVGSNVWAAGDNGSFTSSNDLGVSWFLQTIGGGQKLNSVYFIDSLTGYIAGNNGLLLKTVNSGSVWNIINAGVNYNLTNVKFTDVFTGFISGESSAILKTTNSGATWSNIATPSLSSLRCFDVSGNEIIAGSSENILYRSTNLGISWESIKLNIQSLPGINALVITNPFRYLVVLESGTIWLTSNGGTSFNYAQNEFLDQLNAIAVLGNRYYAVSRKHVVVLRSLTNGNNWALTPNTTFNINYIQYLSQNAFNTNKILDINYQSRGVLYILENRSLYRSLNYGGNWNVISSVPDSSTSTARSTQLLVCAKDSSKMLAGVYNTIAGNMDETKIYRTSDYGVSWVKVFTAEIDFIGNYMTQDFNHPDTVYLGVKDSVFRSTNFGLSWSKICEYNFEDWCDISVKHGNSQILYAATNHYPAKLHKSVNGGVNWNTIDLVVDTSYSEMPCLAINNFNPNMILHAQLSILVNQCGLKRSYNSGNSWLFDQFPGTSWSVDIAKDDPTLFIYGSVSYDPLFLTSNSGGNFLGLPNTYAEQILFYDRSNLYINNHGAVYKMRVKYNMPVIGIQSISSEIPERYLLEQNYPNPFNPVTAIRFSVPEQGRISLVIYDALGRIVKELVNENVIAGVYSVDFDASNYPSGFYFYRLSGEGFSDTKKMVLVK